jgi:hypothetical protein
MKAAVGAAMTLVVMVIQDTNLLAQQAYYTPAAAYEMALADARALKAAGLDPRNCVWLWSGYHQDSLRDRFEDQLQAAVVANSLNFSTSRLVPPQPVDRDWRLVRYDTSLDSGLGLRRADLDALGERGSGRCDYEPYFHDRIGAPAGTEVVVNEYWPGGVWPVESGGDGKSYPAGHYPKRVKSDGKQRVVTGDWLSKPVARELYDLTGTEYPVFRADWFAVYAFQPPAYQRFKGNPKDFAEVLKLAGADVTHSEGEQLRAAVEVSGVATYNRGLRRTPTKRNRGKGRLSDTFDFLSSVGPNDVLQNLSAERRDAGEVFFTLPNGLEGTAIVGGDGATADHVDGRIATNRRTRLRDKTIYDGYSCRLCHPLGANHAEDEVRLTARPPLAWAATRDGGKVNDLYLADDYNRVADDDRRSFGSTVFRLTGRDAAAVALGFEELHWRYSDRPVTPEVVAAEAGYPVDTVKQVIAEQSKVGLHHAFSRMILGRGARRDHYEQAFGELMRVLARAQPAGGRP